MTLFKSIEDLLWWRAEYNRIVYNAETLQDVHQRAHESLRRLIAFCGELTEEELRRPLPGFGFPTILRQLEHTIGAEVYWQTVVTKGYTQRAEQPALPDLVAMEAYRQRTATVTQAYLGGASETELNSPREMISDPGETRRAPSRSTDRLSQAARPRSATTIC
jgi:uncharacterized damage-inducible protein DinB